jgi:two-component sensor histidine kinase
MFHLQAHATTDPKLVAALQAASGRVSAVARVHERLYRDADIQVVDLSTYLADVCHDLAEVVAPCTIDFESSGVVRLETDRAVLLALLVGELVTNAAKHAYATAAEGTITVRIIQQNSNQISLAVRDAGTGLPDGFTLEGQRGFGMRIVRAFLRPTGATIAVHRRHPGTEFVVEIPIDRRVQ